MSGALRCGLILLPLLAATPALAADDPALTAQLKAETQAMIDAIPPGDAAVWDKVTDPALIYVDESNRVLDKAALLKELTPLAPGLVGKAYVTDYRLQRHGDVAVATYVDDEGLDYHGQHVQTKFRTTDTWIRRADGWKLIATMTLAALDDPPAIALTPAQLSQYVGDYALTPDIHYAVTLAGGHLMGQRTGGKPAELKAEVADLFFVAGSPRSRKVFARDARGAVVAFADRREGHDILWKKVS